MKKLNIGILTDQFIKWGGGIDFIRLILNGLHAVNETGELEINIFVYIPKQREYPIRIKNAVKLVLNKLFKKQYQLQNIISKKSFINTFKSIDDKIKVIHYNSEGDFLAKKVNKNNIDFALPAFNALAAGFPKPWAGYIYDFQHKYYPNFFSEEEINKRDNQFRSMLNQASTVIVNAASVKNDIDKFLGSTKTRVIALPFCPVLNLDYFNNDVKIEKYNLPSDFFMISNQFWKHKDHVTAFKAFRIFIDKLGDENFCLICTGQIHDSRFPDYFDSLKALISELNLTKNIRILGYIPKIDQLQILKNCVAVIQPTLFEGGPGGGAVYESVAYGKASIVSDIPVNKELDDETVTFFKSGSESDLAEKMYTVFKTPIKNYEKEELIEKNNKSLKRFGNSILSIFEAEK